METSSLTERRTTGAPRWLRLTTYRARAILSQIRAGSALAETVIGLYKTELIKPHGPWRTAGQVEVSTLHYVDGFNHQRLFEDCGDIPPDELETAYYRQNASLTEAS